MVEITGESTLLHLDWHGHALHMQMAGRHAASSGATLRIGFNPQKFICSMPKVVYAAEK